MKKLFLIGLRHYLSRLLCIYPCSTRQFSDSTENFSYLWFCKYANSRMFWSAGQKHATLLWPSTRKGKTFRHEAYELYKSTTRINSRRHSFGCSHYQKIVSRLIIFQGIKYVLWQKCLASKLMMWSGLWLKGWNCRFASNIYAYAR